MKRALWAVLLLAVLAGAAWAAYSRDITGVLRKDAATLTEAVLKAIEYIIDNGVTVNAGTNLNTSALALDASVDGLEGATGTTTTAKADVDGNGAVIAHLRRIGFEADRIGDLLNGGLPAALGAGGGLKVDGSGTSLPVTEASAAAIAAAVEKMDDWDAVHDSGAASDGPQVMAAYDSTLPTAVGDGDAVRLLGDEYGRLRLGKETDLINKSNTSADATGAGMALAIGTASKKAALLCIVISADTAMTVTITDEDGNFGLAPIYVAATGGAVIPFPASAPWLFPTADKDIKVVASVAGNIGVTVTGYYYP